MRGSQDMAKGGKAKGARKSAKAKSSKAKGTKAKRGRALGGRFTHYVLFIVERPIELEMFRADRRAHIAAYEKKHGFKFTAFQIRALIFGSDKAINHEIDRECAMNAGPVPYATHVSGGPLGSGGPTPPPPPPRS
jgi:hypothetical protein